MHVWFNKTSVRSDAVGIFGTISTSVPGPPDAMLAARTATAGVPVVPTSSVNSFCFSWKIRTFHQLQLGLHPKGSSTGTWIFKPRGTLQQHKLIMDVSVVPEFTWKFWKITMNLGKVANFQHEFRYSSQFSGTVEQWLMHPPPVAAPVAAPSWAQLCNPRRSCHSSWTRRRFINELQVSW